MTKIDRRSSFVDYLEYPMSYRTATEYLPFLAMPRIICLMFAGLVQLVNPCHAGLPDTIARVSSGVVGIGTVQKTRRPPAKITGTGFVVGDGRHVITNSHVIPKKINEAKLEYLAVFTGRGNSPKARQAVVLMVDEAHDLALLRIEGEPMPALSLGDSSRVREGEEYAFTGFPLGVIFGLNPVTHRGIISSITPIALQANSAGHLDPAQIRRLRSPYNVFQLDATAYPGNSGSPLYDTETGQVIGIVNMVFIKEGRENILAKPSGISYAIPARYAMKLLQRAGVSQ
jgi:serine protease Do